MRTLLALSAGPAAGAALYAALFLLAPPSAHGEQHPWVVHFRDGGLTAYLTSVSHEPQAHFAIIERREAFKAPPLARATLVTLEVSEVRLQIAEFGTEELAARVVEEEERQKVPRFKGSNIHYHVQRVGRRIAVVPPIRDLRDSKNVDGALAAKVLRAFAAGAEKLP